MYNDEGNVMDAILKGRINLSEEIKKSEPKKVELGYGKGIGHTSGTYEDYIKQLEDANKSQDNGAVFIGKNVTETDNKYSVINFTDEFTIGDLPHVLVTYKNIINGMTLKAEWLDDNNDVILEQFYEIPPPHSLQYAWWDLYGIFFMGPEKLEEGKYSVKLSSREFGVKGNIKQITSCQIDFTMATKKETLEDRPRQAPRQANRPK